MHKLLSAILLIFLMSNLYTQELSRFPFLSSKTTGAEQFIEKHPSYDGRGVLVVIVDSGIDVAVEGLLETTEGKLKVIDVMDFTSQGEIYFSALPADTTENGKTILSVNGYSIYGFDKLPVYPSDSIFYGGSIRESGQKGSYLSDLNEDGDSDDLFAFIAFKTLVDEKETPVVFMDLNGDHHVDDEAMLLDYAVKPGYFKFRNLDLQEKPGLPTFTLKIRWDQFKIVLHTDDNSHGTHVAGIAAGYKINGQEGYNGIAPGAQVISCKIGDNRRSGGASPSGAMEKAFQYGIQRARALGMPVVFNLSYGIGSEWEGHAEMEKYLDNLLEQNRDVIICTSAGNSGPGISTSGLPSSARSVIASGAVMTAETATSVYEAQIEKDQIFYFSARGATVMKPDIISPGAASSTVPKFSYDGNMWGTSQASPQTTGVVALLLSAISQEGLPIVNSLVKRAIINSGKELEGYQLIDQGGGIPQVEKAFNIYKKLINRQKNGRPIDFLTEVDNPAERTGVSQAFLWRSGSRLEEELKTIRFKFEPVFEKYPEPRKKVSYEAYQIFSTVPWLKPVKKQSYYKNFQSIHIPVKINPAYFSNPGLYSGKIYAVTKGQKNRKENILFEGWVTIVIPDPFTPENDFQITHFRKNNTAGQLHRYYIQVTPEISHFKFKLYNEGSYCNEQLYVYAPDGRRIYRSSRLTPEKREISYSFSEPDLVNGVYEIIVYTMYSASEKTSYKLQLTGMPLGLVNDHTSFVYDGKNNPGGELTVINNGDNLVRTALSGKVYGIFKYQDIAVENSDFSSIELHIPQNINRISVEYQLSAEDYLKMTDVSIQVLNEVGDIIYNSGLNYPASVITFTVKPGKTYFLETTAGFARESQISSSWKYHLKLFHFYKDPINLDVQDKMNWYSSIAMVPFSQRVIKFNFKKIPEILPEGYIYWGQLFYQVDQHDHMYRRTIYIEPGNK